jgi:hypothetical protein
MDEYYYKFSEKGKIMFINNLKNKPVKIRPEKIKSKIVTLEETQSSGLEEMLEKFWRTKVIYILEKKNRRRYIAREVYIFNAPIYEM